MSAGLIQPSAQSLDRHDGFRWVLDSAGQVRVRVEVGSAYANRLRGLARIMDSSIASVRQTLMLPDDSLTVDVFALDSVARMQALLGRSVGGRAFPGTSVFAIVIDGDWPATVRHEMTHVLATRQWGKAADRWVSEGTATYAGNQFGGRDLHRLVRDELVATGRVLSLRTLAEDFGRHPDAVTYLQAASVVRFLRERYGLAALRAAWSRGLDALPSVTGLSLEAFEKAWREQVAGNTGPLSYGSALPLPG